MILGLQGRYFLIFLPILLLISKEFTLKLIRLNILLLVIFIFITFNIFSTIKNRYFNYFSNSKLGKKCIDGSKISDVIVVNQEFKKKLFNRTCDRESIESLVIGFCIKIINEKDSPSYTYRIELMMIKINLLIGII